VSLQFPPQSLEILHPALDLGKLRGDQLLETGPQVLAAPGVGVGGDLADARQREADLLRATNESKALEIFLGVDPVPRRCPIGFGQEPKRLVVPNGLGIDATFPPKLTDPHCLPSSWEFLTCRGQYRSSSRLEMQELF
jgi:hypothetical protein